MRILKDLSRQTHSPAAAGESADRDATGDPSVARRDTNSVLPATGRLTQRPWLLRATPCAGMSARNQKLDTSMRRYLQPILGPPGQRNHFTSDTNRAGDWITLAGRSSLTDVVHRRLHSNTVACERARHWEFIHTTHRTSKRKEGARCGSPRPSPLPP